MLTALIVDDEPLAREELRLLLQASGCIEVLGECAMLWRRCRPSIV